jgi:hypothetical protein
VQVFTIKVGRKKAKRHKMNIWIPAKCVRPHLVRSNAEARSNAGARSNVVLVIPQFAVGFHRFQAAPSLFAAVERTFCDRT